MIIYMVEIGIKVVIKIAIFPPVTRKTLRLIIYRRNNHCDGNNNDGNNYNDGNNNNRWHYSEIHNVWDYNCNR